MKDKVAFRIRKLRESRDYSQENMANDLNITPSAYSKIERGVTDPSVGRLAQIADILGVEITYFFQENAQDNPQSPYGYATKTEVAELSKLIKQLKQEISLIRKEFEAVKTIKKNKK